MAKNKIIQVKEIVGLYEKHNNAHFNSIEFDGIRMETQNKTLQ